MHDDLKPFSQSPSQKFHKNSINFEKPQSLSKIPKVRSENMKCMIEWVKRITPDERIWSLGRKSLGNKVFSEKNVFGRWKDTKVSREIERSESEIAQTLYIEPLKSGQIERYREVLRFKLRQMHLSSSYPGGRNFLDGSRSYREAIKIAIKRNWKAR